MRVCPQCKIEMKVLNKNIGSIARINRKPVPFLVAEGHQDPIHAILYVCPKCGLVQTYIKEEDMGYLKRL